MSIIVFGVKCTEGMTNCVNPVQTEEAQSNIGLCFLIWSSVGI